MKIPTNEAFPDGPGYSLNAKEDDKDLIVGTTTGPASDSQINLKIKMKTKGKDHDEEKECDPRAKCFIEWPYPTQN